MSKPRPVADLLNGVLRHTQTQVRRRELNEALAEAVGPELAKHCWVAGYRAGKLVVETDSAPLYSELTGFRREAIRVAMNDTLKQQKVARLIFRMGGTGHV